MRNPLFFLAFTAVSALNLLCTGCSPAAPDQANMTAASATTKSGEYSSDGINDIGEMPTPSSARKLRGSEFLPLPCKINVRFGSSNFEEEENLLADAIITKNAADFSYSLSINAHPKDELFRNALSLRVSSLKKSLRDLEVGTYDLDYAQMQANDVFWSVSFFPDESKFYELESGSLAFKKISAQPNGGLFLQGSFDGVGGCFDMKGKLQKNAPFSGNFEIFVQDNDIPAIL